MEYGRPGARALTFVKLRVLRFGKMYTPPHKEEAQEARGAKRDRDNEGERRPLHPPLDHLLLDVGARGEEREARPGQ